MQNAAPSPHGIAAIKQHADESEREIDPEHYGALLAYTDGPLPNRFLELIKLRQPDKNPGDLVVSSRKELRPKIEAFIETGASEFVVMPLGEPPDWKTEIEALAADLLPLQNSAG